MSLEGLWMWFQEQATILMFLIMTAMLVIAAWRRAWIGAVGSLLGMSLFLAFIINPDLLESVSAWFTGLLNIG